MTRKPSNDASRAIAQPLMPPPMMSRSWSMRLPMSAYAAIRSASDPKPETSGAEVEKVHALAHQIRRMRPRGAAVATPSDGKATVAHHERDAYAPPARPRRNAWRRPRPSFAPRSRQSRADRATVSPAGYRKDFRVPSDRVNHTKSNFGRERQ